MYITHISNGWNACTSNNTILSICYPYGPWYLKNLILKIHLHPTSTAPPSNFLLRNFTPRRPRELQIYASQWFQRQLWQPGTSGWATKGDTEIASTLVNVVTIDVHWCTLWTMCAKAAALSIPPQLLLRGLAVYGMLGLKLGMECHTHSLAKKWRATSFLRLYSTTQAMVRMLWSRDCSVINARWEEGT